MKLKMFALLGVCLGAAASAAPSVSAQNCTASKQAAIECFVANAVTTKITEPRYGMSLRQFKTYGVAVSEILQTHHTYLVLTGISSAIADAMPPKNADGSANQSAQDLAVSQIVDAVISGGFTTSAIGCHVSGSAVVLARSGLGHERQRRHVGDAHARCWPPHRRFLHNHWHVKWRVNWTQVNASLAHRCR